MPVEVPRLCKTPCDELAAASPAGLASDIAEHGLTLVGGGSLLRCFDQLLNRETRLHVNRDNLPLTTVARGAGAALDSIQLLPRKQ